MSEGPAHPQGKIGCQGSRLSLVICKHPGVILAAVNCKVGDPVMLMGLSVGQITSMEPMSPEEFHHNIYVEFQIKAPYYGYLWTIGSRAKVTTADLLGKRVLEVTKGTGGHATYVFYPLKELTLAQAEALPDPRLWRFAEDIYDVSGTNLLVPALSPLSLW